MRERFISALGAVTLILTASWASAVLAQPVDTGTVAPTPDAVISAWQSGQIGVAVGLGLAILVGLFRKIGAIEWIPQTARKYVTAGLAVAVALASGLAMGLEWPTVLVEVVTAAASAFGGFLGGEKASEKMAERKARKAKS